LWPGQELYEGIRPVLMLGQPIKERAREIGFSAKTLSRTLDRFVQLGLPGLEQQPLRDGDRRRLPAPLREHILRLKAEHPPLTANEIATICAIAFDRAINHSTVQRVLARFPLPELVGRRFPHYQEMPDGEERRAALLHLHLEGWTTARIAEYLGVSRQGVTTFLRHRWVEEGVAGLPDKPRVAKGPRKVTLPVAAAVKGLQETSAIGAHRMAAALKQRGIELSPATCGRIMALNREVYRLPTPVQEPKPKKPMPFAASRPHEWWSVDIRYIEHHRVPGIDGPIYILTILDNYSRFIVTSMPSPKQDLDAYLLVLFTAIHAYGAPEGLVSDGGSVFRANQALAIYEGLAISKERIERRRPWQNFVETHFAIMKRMADYSLEQAPTWEAFCAAHARFVADYNCQEHFAHQDRPDGLHSPREVLRWLCGRQMDLPSLQHLFFARHATRRLGRTGYVRFQNWSLYGEEGLAGEEAGIWLMKETLTIAFHDDPLAQYGVAYRSDRRTLKDVGEAQLVPTQYDSPRLPLWGPDAVEWHKVRKLPPYARRKRPARAAEWEQQALPMEKGGGEAGARRSRLRS
jgi:transposase